MGTMYRSNGSGSEKKSRKWAIVTICVVFRCCPQCGSTVYQRSTWSLFCFERFRCLPLTRILLLYGHVRIYVCECTDVAVCAVPSACNNIWIIFAAQLSHGKSRLDVNFQSSIFDLFHPKMWLSAADAQLKSAWTACKPLLNRKSRSRVIHNRQQ